MEGRPLHDARQPSDRRGCSNTGPLAPSLSISPFPGPDSVRWGMGRKGDPQHRGLRLAGVGGPPLRGRLQAQGTGSASTVPLRPG